jgi:hypothetical protein
LYEGLSGVFFVYMHKKGLIGENNGFSLDGKIDPVELMHELHGDRVLPTREKTGHDFEQAQLQLRPKPVVRSGKDLIPQPQLESWVDELECHDSGL